MSRLWCWLFHWRQQIRYDWGWACGKCGEVFELEEDQ